MFSTLVGAGSNPAGSIEVFFLFTDRSKFKSALLLNCIYNIFYRLALVTKSYHFLQVISPGIVAFVSLSRI